MYLLVILHVLNASTFTLCKYALCYSKPFFFIAVRMALAGSLLLGYSYLMGLTSHFKKSDIMWFALLILFHIYGAYVLGLWALQFVSSSQSAFYYSLLPFFVAIFSYRLFAEKLTGFKMAGLICGFCGLALQNINLNASSVHELVSFSWPAFGTLVAVASSGLGWVVVRVLVKEKGYSSPLIHGVSMSVGGVLVFVTSWLFEGWHQAPVTSWLTFFELTLLTIAVANIAFYNLYGYLLKRYTVTFVAFAGFMCPLFSAAFGRVFLKEPVSLIFVVSVVLVSVGLYLFYRGEGADTLR